MVDICLSFWQSGIRYPRLCEPVTRRLLPALRKKQQDPFIEEEELVSTIEREECPGQHKEVIHKVVDFLDESGEVSVCISKTEDVVKYKFLCCYLAFISHHVCLEQCILHTKLWISHFFYLGVGSEGRLLF